MQNRRHFIKKFSALSTSSICFSTIATSAVLQSCSTIDELLITDPSDLGDTVIIVGGGISGMYAAYQLRKRKIPYRIFEASSRFGGQILSDQGFEYGAFEFLNSDSNLLALAKDLNVKIEKTEAQSWIFKNGTYDFLSQLVDRIGGVLPQQQIRLRSKLIQLQSSGYGFKATFTTDKSDKSDKTYKSSKIILALPVDKLFSVRGVLEPKAESLFQPQTEIRVVIPFSKLSSKTVTFKPKIGLVDDIQFSAKMVQGLIYIDFKGNPEKNNYPVEIEKMSSWISEKIFDQPKLNLQLSPENIYVWKSWGRLPSKEQFMPQTMRNRIIVSDGLVTPAHRIESLLISVNQQIDEFL